MGNEFSFIEMLLIRKLVKINSALEISAIIEKPFSDVRTYINDNLLFLPTKKIVVTKKIDDEKQLSARHQSENEILKFKPQRIYETERKTRTPEPRFKTRNVDFAKLISVRVDKNTVLQVMPGADVDALKKRYLQHIQDSKQVEPVNKIVKKV